MININIQVTDDAKEELAPIMEENTQKSLRLFVQGFGWGGPRLGIALDELTEEDEQVSHNGIDVIFAKRDKNYFHQATIDFEDSNYGKGFIVRSANSGAC